MNCPPLEHPTRFLWQLISGSSQCSATIYHGQTPASKPFLESSESSFVTSIIGRRSQSTATCEIASKSKKHKYNCTTLIYTRCWHLQIAIRHHRPMRNEGAVHLNQTCAEHHCPRTGHPPGASLLLGAIHTDPVVHDALPSIGFAQTVSMHLSLVPSAVYVTPMLKVLSLTRYLSLKANFI